MLQRHLALQHEVHDVLRVANEASVGTLHGPPVEICKYLENTNYI